MQQIYFIFRCAVNYQQCFLCLIPGLLQHSDLDERALDALKEFPPEGGISVLKQFAESNLEHVGNKSAYLCGVMKTYRQKNKMPGGPGGDSGMKKGPDEAKLKVSCVLDMNYTLC